MKRRNREISIFNMSTIDLFACAMGAFILLTLILLPYYLKIDRSYLDIIEQLREELSEAQTQIVVAGENLAQCDSQLAQVNGALQENQEQLAGLQSELQNSQSALQAARESEQQQSAELQACSNVAKRNFILVLMSWQSEDDIDLHVVDSANNRYYYNVRNYVGSVASFEEDNTRGPGNEIWLHPSAEPGEYRIFYNYYRRRTGASVTVRGSVFHQQGKFALPEINLTQDLGDNFQDAPLVATIVVDADGTISVR